MNYLRVAIIGAGVSGLAAALRLLELSQGKDLHLDLNILDGAKKPGGTLGTVKKAGFLMEEGPDCFITDKPAGMAMVKRLGLEDRLVRTNPDILQSFILKGERLHPIPEGFYLMAPSRLMPLITTPLLSIRGKLRACFEPFVPVRKDAGDESIGDFVIRRLGREVLDYLAQPLMGGVYNADPFELSLETCAPRFKEMEIQYGSLLKAMAARRLNSQTRVSGARYSLFVSFKDGMQSFAEALASKIPPECLWMQHPVESLAPSGHGTWVVTTQGHTQEVEKVVLAIQPSKMRPLLKSLDPNWDNLLEKIPAHDSATLNLGFRRQDVGHPLNGFGFVVPSKEKRLIVGCTFASQKFPGRAPEGTVLLRVFLGADAVAVAQKEGEEALLEDVLIELSPLLKLHYRPMVHHLSLYTSSMSYYRPGHADLVENLLKKVSETKGLYLAGNGLKGIGIPDAIAAGECVADKIFQDLQTF